MPQARTAPENKKPAESTASGGDPVRDSLDELARLADALVDGLTDEETAEAPVAKAEPPQPPAPPEPTMQAAGPPEIDEITISLDDDEDLPEEKSAPPPAPAAGESERRASMLKAVEELEEASPTPTPAPAGTIEVAGDSGEDIEECLDAVLGGNDAGPETAEIPLPETPSLDVAPVEVAPVEVAPEPEPEAEAAVPPETTSEPEEAIPAPLADLKTLVDEYAADPEKVEPLELVVGSQAAVAEARRRALPWLIVAFLALAGGAVWWFLKHGPGA